MDTKTLPPIGAPAYFDSFTGGLIPCKVVSHGHDNFLDRPTVRVILTHRGESRGGYQPRERLDVPVRYVVPRSAIVTRDGHHFIRAYSWTGEQKEG